MGYVEPSKIEQLEKTVENLKLNTGLSYPENNLIDIAKGIGIDVVSADLPDYQGKKVKGYIKWFTEEDSENCDARIYINENQPETTKTFTLAHELGHYLLHKNTDNFRIDLEDYSLESDPNNQETEANYFAGALLMPRDKFTTALHRAKNIDEVAALFGVSVPAVESRIKWLGM